MSSNKTTGPILSPAEMLRGNWLSILILAIAAAFFIGSFDLPPDAQKFPRVVSVGTIVLCLLELTHSIFVGGGPGGETPKTESKTDTRDAVMLGSWIIHTAPAIYAFGILPTAFLATAIYFRVFAELKLLPAILAGVGQTLFLWIAFELLAGFRLYGGVVW